MTVDLAILSPQELELVQKLRQGGIKPPKTAIAQAQVNAMSITEWAEKYYYIPETGMPVVLEPLQTCLLPYILNPNSLPPFGFTEILWTSVKKSAKTATAGVVARYCAETWGFKQEIYVLANDEEQAKGRIYQSIKNSIELDPRFDRKTRILTDEFGRQTWRVIEDGLTYLPTGSTINVVNIDYRGSAGGNPSASFWSELWGYTCLDNNTTLLTRRGWLDHQDLNVDDSVATLNAQGEFEWQQPEAVSRFHHTGDMYRFQHRRSDMLVTSNHRVFGAFYTRNPHHVDEFSESKWEHKTAEEASNYYLGKIKADAKWTAPDKQWFSLPDGRVFNMTLWMQFFGWYIAEGYQQDYHIGITQQDHQVKNRLAIEAILISMDLSYSSDARGFHIYDVKLCDYLKQFGKSEDKFVPTELKECSRLELTQFLISYFNGDGWEAGRDGYQCVTVSPKLADDLLEIGLKCGFVPRLMKEIPPGRQATLKNGKLITSQQTQYRLSFSTGTIAWQRDHNHWSTEPYDGTVWCVTVPNSTIYARRNGYCYWTGNTEKHERLFDEMTPVPTRGRSIRWIETYAGFEGESKLLRKIWDQAQKQGRRLTRADLPDWPYDDPDDELPLWVYEPARLFAYIDQNLPGKPPRARRMSWLQGPKGNAYYQQQASQATMTPESYDRFHNNLWQSPETAFIPIETYYRNYSPDLPPLDNKELTIMGVDAAVSGDCCAVVLVTRNPLTGKFDQACLRKYKKFDPPRGGKIDYGQEGGLEATIRQWLSEHYIYKIVYDEYQLHDMMTRIRREGLTAVHNFSQGADRMAADKMLYDCIIQQRWAHHDTPGTYDTDFSSHLKHSAKQQNAREDTKLRIIKNGSGEKIDLVVAASMATHACLELLL